MRRRIPQAWLEWGFLGLLVALCATLSVFQYRWTGDVSKADRARLRASLDQQLAQLGAAFHRQLNFACNGLHPPASEMEPGIRASAFADRYRRWSENSPAAMFSRIAMVIPDDGETSLYELDLMSMTLKPIEWPPAWQPLAEMMRRRVLTHPSSGGDQRPAPPREAFRWPGGPRWTDVGPNVIEMPVFGTDGREAGWIILEVSLDFVRTRWLPELVRRHLNTGTEPDFDVEVFVREYPRRDGDGDPGGMAGGLPRPPQAQPGQVIFTTLATDQRIGANPDSSINVFSPIYFRPGALRASVGQANAPEPVPMPGFAGRWTIAARHHAGSLDAVVAGARVRNLLVSFSLLCLILIAGFAIIRSTRQSRRLAEMQLNFVAGISHELRTPLTVIRGAGHNLLNGVVREPKQLQKYGGLIVEHAELLTGIVEQVLAFTAIRRGSATVEAKPVWLGKLLPEAVESASPEVTAAHCTVDLQVPRDLPPVMGDPVALRRAFQNLITNAARHGGSGGWIGIAADLQDTEKQPTLEVRVSDRGPGIPEEELNQIFEPFYRGRNARADHVRGTGLGLSLIREIAEAHKGTVSVRNRMGTGAEFVVRLPAASTEQYDEFAHTDG